MAQTRSRRTIPVGVARRAAAFGAAPTLGGMCWALCAWEARLARRGPRPFQEALPGDGAIGPAGPPVRLTWLGDSLATGLGVEDVRDTPAHVVARLLERPVEVTVLARPGARAVDVVRDQVPRLDPRTDLVVVCVGANDVASMTARAAFAAALDDILRGTAPLPTVVLSLPDMATADRMAQPLRSLAGARARWFDLARARVAAAHRHAHSVDIAALPQGTTRAQARAHLCADRFHPGPVGYRMWAERIATVAHELLPALGQPRPEATSAMQEAGGTLAAVSEAFESVAPPPG